MLTAGTELARGSVALTCIRDNHSRLSVWLVLSYSLLSVFSYNCSIFFNLVLTIVKTIHLSNPFYRLQTGAIKTALVVAPLLSLVVCAADVFCWKVLLSHRYSWDRRSCFVHWLYVEAITYVGEGVLLYFFKDFTDQKIGGGVLMCSQYSLPSLVVLVCMCIQVYFIKKMAVLTHDTRDSVHRAHYTVLLVSLSFFVCTCTFPVLFSINITPHSSTNVIVFYRYLAMVYKYTLPLLNCIIFLLILVIRRCSIRQKNWECLQKLFFYPVLIYRNLSARWQNPTILARRVSI